MSYSDHKKVYKQLKVKPPILRKYKKHNSPKERSCGKNIKRCRRCGRTGAHIQKYGLNMCRQCFREIATNLGFKKFN